MSRQTPKEDMISAIESFNYAEKPKKMSLVDDEAMSSDEEELECSSGGSSQPQAKRRKVIVSDDEDDEDDESKGQSNEYTEERYEDDFGNVIQGVFSVQDESGKDWAKFKSELDKLLDKSDIDMEKNSFEVYMYLMCWQFAGAVADKKVLFEKGVPKWELMTTMKPLLKRGLLNKYPRPQKKAGFNFARSAPQEEAETGTTTTQFLQKHGLAGHTGLAQILQSLAPTDGLAESEKYPGFFLFVDTAPLDKVLDKAALQYLKKGGTSAPPKSARSAKNSGGTSFSSEQFVIKEEDMPPNEDPSEEEYRMYWKTHVIDIEALQAAIDDHHNKAYIFRKLQGNSDEIIDDAEEAVNAIAMKCGGRMWKLRTKNKQPIKKDINDKNMYTVEDRPDMVKCFRDVLKAYKII